MRLKHWLYTIPLRLRSLFRRDEVEQELEDELCDHLERKTREFAGSGLTAEEARRRVLREFGGVELSKDNCRDARRVNWIQELIQDLRYGMRMLRKSPGFAAVAVVTVALGIGANTALFSVVNGVLLNPLPYPQSKQIVTVANWYEGYGEASISYLNFVDWARLNHSFSAMAAYRRASFNMTGRGEAEYVTAMEVSASFFPLLGVNAALGRTFSSSEDQLGGAPAIILSGGFWKTKFGGSPEVIGTAVTLDGTDYTVVGVIPQDFYFCCSSIGFQLSDIYVPLGASRDPWVRDRRITPGIHALGRMKQGVTLAQATADMQNATRYLEEAFPEANKGMGLSIAPLKDAMVRNIRSVLLVLLAAVGFVLLIACVNVANLLLARATGRHREFAIRAALGASRGRVLRQVLTESVVLGIAGGGLGLLLAAWGTRAALAVLPSALPRANDVGVDSRVLLFTLTISLAAGILFGLAPALRISQPDVHETLKEGGRGGSGARYRTQNVFLVAEIALAVVLLIGAGLTVRTLAHLWGVNPGFDPHNVLSFGVGFPPAVAGADATTLRTTLRQFTEKIASVPGVTAVSVANGALPMGHMSALIFWREGQPKPATDPSMPYALWYRVDPDYLKVMNIPLRRGRFITPQDDITTPSVCVIDEEFARMFFGNEDPIGKRLNFDLVYSQPLQIVGVVGHVKQYGLDETTDSPIRAQFYMPLLQLPDDQLQVVANSATGYVIRTRNSPDTFSGALRDALREFNSKAVLYAPQTMDEILSASLASRRFTMILLAVFAALALLLAAIGIYGVVSYVTGRRAHEIGLRVALGAQPSDVLKIVLGHGARLAFIGVAIGLGAATGLARLMSKILYGVSSTDPLTFALVAVVLAFVALGACYIPARRALRVDPVVALRSE